MATKYLFALLKRNAFAVPAAGQVYSTRLGTELNPYTYSTCIPVLDKYTFAISMHVRPQQAEHTLQKKEGNRRASCY